MMVNKVGRKKSKYLEFLRNLKKYLKYKDYYQSKLLR